MWTKRNKIFILGDSIYRSEKTFLNNIKSIISRQNFETTWAAYQIFEVSESGTLLDYKITAEQTKVSNERDLQLKSLLNQLDELLSVFKEAKIVLRKKRKTK